MTNYKLNAWCILDSFNWKGTPREHTSWPHVKENVLNFPLAGFLWWFTQHVYSRSTCSASNFGSIECSHLGMLFPNKEQRKIWFMMSRTLLLTMTTYFVTSQTQTATHKLAGLTAVFSHLSHPDLDKLDHQLTEQSCEASFFSLLFLNSIPADTAFDASSSPL